MKEDFTFMLFLNLDFHYHAMRQFLKSCDTTSIAPTLYISGRQCGHWPFAQQCSQQSLLDVAVCISFDPKKQAVGTQLATSMSLTIEFWHIHLDLDFFETIGAPLLFCTFLQHLHFWIHVHTNSFGSLSRQVIFQPDSSIFGSKTLVTSANSIGFG